MSTIELRGVTVAHDGHTVLEHVDLRVASGEVLALVGPSGSGKTSLLRILAGFDPVAAGRVLIDGQDVTTLPPNERGLGMVAQGAPLHPGLDVEGNIRLPLDLRGDDREGSTERVRGEALRFNVSRLLQRLPGQLSAGEQAATAAARSVIRGPSALLLDEPAANLDTGTRATVLQQLGIAQRARGTTILISTNDITVAAAMADRIAVLGGGTIAQVDTLAALRQAPVTLGVADLVAPQPLNRVDGSVVPGDGGRRTRIRTAAGDVPTWHGDVRRFHGRVVVAAEPHDVLVVQPEHGDLRGRVDRVATTGARRLVTVDTPAGNVVADVDGSHDVPGSGTTVGLELRRALVATPAGDVVAVVTGSVTPHA
jgi:ABC-type sugar transport system ATPase subunit